MTNTKNAADFGTTNLIDLEKAAKASSNITAAIPAHSPLHGEEPGQAELHTSLYDGNGSILPAGPSSAWFRNQFDILYNDVVEFVNKNFSLLDVEVAESGTSLWINGMPQELLNYTQLVAEADESPENWDLMLLDRNTRGYLLIGVLGRILEAHIFRELLFGTSSVHKEQLEREESSMPWREGFSRTAARAQSIVKALGDRELPVDFHTAVSRLSRQIMAVLLPLWRLLQPTETGLISLKFRELQLVDELERIVSMAGKVSVCIRRSPTIVYFYFENPGSGFAWNDQDSVDNLDHKAYVASKDAVLARFAGDPSKDTASMNNLYHPGVKISVWPSIKRYLPGDGNDGGQKRGFRIYNISNSRVVYHWRLKDRRNGPVRSLSEYVKLKRKEKSLGSDNS